MDIPGRRGRGRGYVGCGGGRNWLGRTFLGPDRQSQHESGPEAESALAMDAACHGLRKPFDDGKAKSSGGFATGGERAETREFLEKLLLMYHLTLN